MDWRRQTGSAYSSSGNVYPPGSEFSAGYTQSLRSSLPPPPSYNAVAQHPQQFYPIQAPTRPGLPSYQQIVPNSTKYSNVPTKNLNYSPTPGIQSFSRTSLHNAPSFSSLTSNFSSTNQKLTNPQSLQYQSPQSFQLTRQQLTELKIQKEAEENAKRQQELNLIAQHDLIRKQEEQKLREEQMQQEAIRQLQLQQKVEQMQREKESFEREQEQKFQRMWQEREEQWKQREQEQIKQREVLEHQAKAKRQEEELRMIEEAKKQAKQKTAEEIRGLYEQRHHQEKEEMKQREAALLALLQKERNEREQREHAMIEQQNQREILIRQQEEKRIADALEIFRAQESAKLRQNVTKEVRAQEERRIKEEFQVKFEQEAATRQQEYQREQDELHQQDEFFDCNWKISHSELIFNDMIGQGAYGEVYKGKLHGKEVAIKRLLVQNVCENSLKEFKQEISIMSNLRHPNLLLFIGACLEPQNIAIVTEFLPMGSLQDVLFAKNIQMDMKKRLTILKEIAQGMNWLHSLKPPFLHRDLKTGNVLLDQHLSSRIADFGLSSVKRLDDNGERVEGPIGSPFYMAPEILLDKPYDTKADVYSFSIVIWETIAHKDPYEGEFETYEEMVEGITMDEMRPEIPSWFPVGIVALLQQCWNTDPNARPTFEQILKQSWFDHILIDYCIPDSQLASQFWKLNFLEKIEVPVDDFLAALRTFCGVNYPNNHPAMKLWQFLVSRASVNGLMNVNISDFNCAVSWYGPMQHPMDLVARPHQYASNPWFYGLVQPPDSLLQSQAPGTWLITQKQLLSDKNAREYSLCYLDPQSRGISKIPFYQDQSGNFHFNNNSFADWESLIDGINTLANFHKPSACKGSPFSFLHK